VKKTLTLGVRFAPTSGGGSPTSPDQTTGTVTITSDDPGGPATEPVCGEATVQSGVRVLVEDATATPINGVDSITLTSKGLHTPQPISIRLTNASVMTANVCGNVVKYHLDTETLPPTQTTGSNPNSSYSINAKEGKKQITQSFSLASVSSSSSSWSSSKLRVVPRR
jgi:hypothetical protein